MHSPFHHAPLRARRPSAIHRVPHLVGASTTNMSRWRLVAVLVGALSCIPLLSSVRPVHCVGDWDHLVHVALMFEAAKAHGEMYVGLASAGVGPVVLIWLAVLAREHLYAFCDDKFARLHACSFTE